MSHTREQRANLWLAILRGRLPKSSVPYNKCQLSVVVEM